MAVVADTGISSFGEFVDHSRELEFRETYVEITRRLCIALSVTVVLASVLLAGNDDALALAARIIQTLLAATACGLALRYHSVKVVHPATYLLAVSVIAGTLVIDASRPPDYLLHVGLDILIILGAYIVIPGLRQQVLFAALCTGSLLILHFGYKAPAHTMAIVSVPIALIVANLVGIGISILYNISRRQLYNQIAVERQMREELDRAQHEVRQLSRLLSMCASCKQIRRADGEWEPVETYMMESEGARVASSLCPDCARNPGSTP